MKYLITPAHLVRKYESVRQFKAIIENSAEVEYPIGLSPFAPHYKGKEMKAGRISDGFHYFDDLYAHRNTLFLEIARIVNKTSNHLMAWCSRRYNNGSLVEKDWFLMGIFDNRDPVVMKDISYHLPISLYKEAASFCEEMFVAPDFDGHDSGDVLQRLKDICK
jgi:hypothetical protein